MNFKHLVAILLVFLLACGGWVILGKTTELRSVNFDQKLGVMVESLYGTPVIQQAPTFAVEIPGSKRMRWLMPSGNDVKVTLDTDYRKKGLLWYPTYKTTFIGTYTIKNEDKTAQKVRLHFDFPAKGGTYDNFLIKVNDAPIKTQIDTTTGVGEIIELAAAESKTFQVGYETRGITEWHYKMDPNVGRVQNFNMVVNTNFKNFDYPDGSWSATTSGRSGGGMALNWKTTDLITSQDIGIVIPEKLNPGPLTSRITFFAPVCLLFFFILVLTIDILYKVNFHPMHYLFVAAGFFAFHLLLCYLAGILNVHLCFIISTIVSVGLVTSYLSAALQGKFPWKMAIGGQIFFLVLFSYSFFLKGITGLTVAIGSVIVLAFLMRVTAHVNWSEVFGRGSRPAPMATPPPIPTNIPPCPGIAD